MICSAVIVTRGNVDLGPIIQDIVPHVDELIIRIGHGGVLERWEGVLSAKHDHVYVQDDDAIVEVMGLLAAHVRRGGGFNTDPFITCNMPEWKRPEYQDGTALVGWGALVPKQVALDALIRYRIHYDMDELFKRECDRVITGLSPLHLVDVPFSHAPWADGPGRMCQKPGDPNHAAARKLIRDRIEVVRKGVRATA